MTLPSSHSEQKLTSPLPQPQQKLTRTQRRNRSKKFDPDGDSRLFKNKSKLPTDNSHVGICLPDLISYLIQNKTLRESVHSAMLSALSNLPKKYERPRVKDMGKPLATHGMSLEPVSRTYSKKGGTAFHLMQETDCYLIINIKLTDHEGDSWRHFVAWDGKVIHDYPLNSKVNHTSDRATKEGSEAVFDKLFPNEEYAEWEVCSVFELRHL